MPAYKDPKKGTWMVKFRYTDWQGNRKETTRRGFATKREARDFEEEYKRKVQGTADMTFQSLYDIYLDDMKQRTKETSIISINNTIQKHVLPVLGQLPISAITPNVIRKWQHELNNYNHNGKSLRPSSILNINRRLATILNFAVKYYGLPQNPMRITGSQGKAERRIDFWSKEEFDTFLSAINHPLYNAFFALLFYSGMRVGEALAITTEDIDFDTGRVIINKTFTNQGKLTTPKTESSNRAIILPASIRKQLRDMISRLDVSSGRIFPVTYCTVNYHFNRGIKLSGVRPLKIHCLRHAHASLLIDQGVPITAISQRLGHTSPKITLAVYSHATQGSDENIANILDQL